MQIIVTTSDKSLQTLKGFAFLFNRYWGIHQGVDIVGFTPPDFDLPHNFTFHSIGKFEHYPANKWSNAFIKILDDIAEERFALFLDDYWIVRPVDRQGVRMLYDYLDQFKNVMKIDLTNDRLYSDPGRYVYGYNTYDNCGYLDLIKSPVGSNYQMSLWGGLWNRNIVREFIVENETAQQIELNGTQRVNMSGNSILVLGTRQSPVVHGNVFQSGKDGLVLQDGGWKIRDSDLKNMIEIGILKDRHHLKNNDQ